MHKTQTFSPDERQQVFSKTPTDMKRMTSPQPQNKEIKSLRAKLL